MAAARLVMTMAVVAIGAGAFLAISTIPAIAPYQQHKPDRTAPVAALAEPKPDTEPAPAYGLAPPTAPGRSDDSFALGTRDGRPVLELPRWVEDGGAWVTLGRRAWHDWVEPELSSDESEEPGYAPRRRYRDEDAPGYAARPRDAERYDRGPPRHWEDEDAGGYDETDRWSPAGDPPAPYAQRGRDRPQFSDRLSADTAADPATAAARRARDAARDVRAAQDADQ